MDEETVRRIVEEVIAQDIVSQEAGVNPTEEAELLSQVHYLLIDNKTQRNLEAEHPEYNKVLTPALSHLNRTSNTSEGNAKIWFLRLKRAIDLILLGKPEQEIKLGEAAFIDSLLIFGGCASEDAVKGWRGKLATERIRTYKVEGGKKKSRWKIF